MTFPERQYAPFESCPDCRYSFRGLPDEGRCPECGFPYDPDTVVWRPSKSLYWLLIASFGMNALAMGIQASRQLLPRLIPGPNPANAIGGPPPGLWVETVAFSCLAVLCVVMLLYIGRVAWLGTFMSVSRRGLRIRVGVTSRQADNDQITAITRKRCRTIFKLKQSRDLVLWHIWPINAFSDQLEQFVYRWQHRHDEDSR